MSRCERPVFCLKFSFGRFVRHFNFDVPEGLGAEFFVDGLKNLMLLHGDLLRPGGVQDTDRKRLAVVRLGEGLRGSFLRQHGFGKAAELLADFYGLELPGEVIFRRGFGDEFLECVKHGGENEAEARREECAFGDP